MRMRKWDEAGAKGALMSVTALQGYGRVSITRGRYVVDALEQDQCPYAGSRLLRPVWALTLSA